MRAGSSRRELFRLFLSEKTDPDPFYEAIASHSIDSFAFPLEGLRVLDLGSGGGYYARAMADAGATVTAADLAMQDVRAAREKGLVALVCDGTQLPFPEGTFDGVLCSNMLEHTPAPEQILEEINRVLVPGGWAWVSWTNWYSPWGGHDIFPLHYLGPKLGLRAWRALFGEPRKNVPYEGLWPTHIGTTLAHVRHNSNLELIDAVPRYYPSQRWILKMPGVREVLTWNCLLLLRRREELASTEMAQTA